MMYKRAIIVLLTLLPALVALFMSLRGPSAADCQALASVAEEDCRHAPLVVHVEEELHDNCRALYEATRMQCLGAQ